MGAELADAPRSDWTLAEIRAIHDLPLPELLYRAQAVHRRHHDPATVQLASLLSVKTGGCQEDCAYCPQSSHHDVVDEAPAPAGAPRPPGVRRAERFLQVDEVLEAARRAKEAGASRFCMGAAWREVKDGPAFDRVLDMVRGVVDLGMEACVTLGMLSDEQARRLKEAGLCAYNHNLDTSRSFYGRIINTRTYDDRLATLGRARRAGLTLCSGGIIGMGESVDDRCLMLRTLAELSPHPESVPINALVPVPGTPLGDQPPVDPLSLVRMIGAARIVLPRSRVRLSAGRLQLSREAQVLCFTAGANSIFYGERLLTTGNPEAEADLQLLRDAGLRPLGAPAQGGERAEARPCAPGRAADQAS